MQSRPEFFRALESETEREEREREQKSGRLFSVKRKRTTRWTTAGSSHALFKQAGDAGGSLALLRVSPQDGTTRTRADMLHGHPLWLNAAAPSSEISKHTSKQLGASNVAQQRGNIPLTN